MRRVNMLHAAPAPARVLVTGASGFVGRHVAEAFRSAGHTVRCLVRGEGAERELRDAGMDTVRGDLSRRDVLAAAADGCDAVVHVAGLIAARSHEEMREVNEGGTARLVTACGDLPRRPRRIVVVSSQAAGGPSSPGRRTREDDEPRPVSKYGATKLLGERAAAASLPDGVELCVVRPPAVFGPRDRGILAFFQAAAGGVVPRVGSRRGAAERRVSLVYGPDLADAILRAAFRPEAAGRTYYAAYDETLPLADVTARIAAAVGSLPSRRGRRMRVLPLPDFVVRGVGVVAEESARLLGRVPEFSRDKAAEFLAPGWECEVSRIRTELGWNAATPLDRALAETAAWYDAQGWI